jgi:hypothetical protein
MKKILNHRLYLPLFVLIVALLSACKKERSNPPVITAVRNYAPAPGDSIVNKLEPGTWVVLIGHNLKDAVEISFDGIRANSQPSLFSDTSAVVQVPGVIPFPSVPAEKLNTIHYTTPEGSTTFAFNVAAPAPTITSISNENANEGDSVHIYGLNFFFIEDFTFAGTKISSYSAAGDGTSINFVLPAITQGGPVIVKTKSGTATTPFNVKDVTTGKLASFEWGDGYQWWGGSQLYSGDPNSGWPPYTPDFPGNPTHFQVLKTNSLGSGEGNTYSSYAVRIASGQWIPTANLTDPVNNWALKFEVSIPQPWNGGTIDIQADGKYIARWEPWQVSANATAAYKTKGWTTITIPFSMFKAKDATLGDGKGAPVTSFTDLLGSSGKSECIAYLHNYSGANTPTGFYGAFDNFRVVKIK